MLPNKVLEKVKSELLNWNSTNLSVMELSHRSPDYLIIHNNLIHQLRILFDIPQQYEILLMHGGATLQYSAIPLNLLKQNETAAYLITGQYSEEAFIEAQKFCNPIKLDLQQEIPQHIEYLYYVDNEVNDGIQLQQIPDCKNKILVCDMTSSFGLKPINILKFGGIFASLQYHMGIPSLSCVIIRNDLIGKSQRKIPSMADYKIMKDYNSIYNTIPCFNVYITQLCVEYLINQGGLQKINEIIIKKASIIYNFLDENKDKFEYVTNIELRSDTSIIFFIKQNQNKERKKIKFLITINTEFIEIEQFLQELKQF